MRIRPTTISAAREFVGLHHRHSRPPPGGLFAAALEEDDQLVGVVIVGRPIARALNDGWTAEVVRLCVVDQPNGCSMLYGAAARAAKALGYRRLVTYTLEIESGISLRAAGWEATAIVEARPWRPCRSVPTRGQSTLFDQTTTLIAQRIRWEKTWS